ncbi:TPA: hypothetical protein QH957_004186 [Enterobacter bugandensis]|nr:hypothetical protein [Enterobacter bugandensis]
MTDTILNETAETPAENTDFRYDAQGRLEQVIAPDGMVTLTRWYLPGEALDARSSPAPDVAALLEGLTLPADVKGAARRPAGFGACPPLPAAGAARLQAQFRYLLLPDRSHTEGELTLYGYGSGDDADEVKVRLVLDGVDVAVQEKDRWQVSLSPGRQAPLVIFTEERVRREAGKVVTCRAETTWHISNATRRHMAVTETASLLPGNREWCTVTTAALPTGSTAILKQQVTSALSGVLLRESQQDGEGKPVTFVVSERDFAGRELSRTAFRWDEQAFLSGVTAGLTPLSRLPAPDYSAQEAGMYERTRAEDGRWQYTCYDGLLRPVSQWLQRVPGDDHAEANRVCLARQSYGADGRVAHSETYDFLPDGVCERVTGGVMAPERADEWFWRAEGQQALQSQDGETEALRLTRVTGRMDEGMTITGSAVTTQTNLPDGRVQVVRESRAGEPDKGMLQAKSLEETDRRGNVTRLTETVATVKGDVLRTWTMTYDDLDRRTSVTAPDGAMLTWTYPGLSREPATVMLTGKDGKTRTLGTRTLPGDGSEVPASLTRGSGKHAPTVTFAGDGVTLPDGARLYAQEEADGSAMTLYRDKVALSTFSVNPATQALRSERLAGADQQMSVVNESLTPKLLGEYRLDRLAGGIVARARTMASLRGRVTNTRSASGVASHHRPSLQGMPGTVRRGELEYRYQWTPEGQCRQVVVQDLRTRKQLVADYMYDNAGNETARTYSLDGKVVVRWAQTWTAQGQLSTLALYRDGSEKASRTEVFTYDTQQSGLRDELLTWEVSVAKAGTDEVCDRAGRAIRKQTYAYDTLGSLTVCETTFADKTTEKRTYAYDDADQPSRRTQETVTDSKGITTLHALTYDAAGNLTASGDRQFTYTTEGQLASVSRGGTLLARYDYDADGVLAAQLDAVKQVTRIRTGDGETFTDAGRVVTGRRIDDTEAGLVTVVQEMSGGAVTGEALYFTLVSPCGAGGDEWWVDDKDGWHRRSAAFTPWGESPECAAGSMASGLGWNGMTPDPAGLYHMGEGYRTYDPRERTFCQPDSLSPFGAGGLNERAYCAGRDPVNWHDPSGHVMLNRYATGEQLASLDRWIEATNPPPSPEAAAWWEWLILGVGALLTVVAMVASGGALLAVVAGAIALTGLGVQGIGMAMRQSAPQTAAKMELAGSVLTGVGGILMPMGGISALTASLLRTAEAASMMLAVTSYALSESNPALSEALGWASMGTGMAGMTHGLALGAAKFSRKGLEKIRDIRNNILINKKLSQLNNITMDMQPRIPAYGDIFKDVKKLKVQKDIGGGARWYSFTSNGGRTRHHVVYSEYRGSDTIPLLKSLNIGQQGANHRVTLVSGGHGRLHGNNWISFDKVDSKLRDGAFLVSDSELMANVKKVLPNITPDVINMHFDGFKKRITDAEKLPGDIIYAFCYSANDERLRHTYKLKSFAPYARTDYVWKNRGVLMQ